MPRRSAGPDPIQQKGPARDKDGDSVFDYEDQCIDRARGTNPDPNKLGCPARDKDGDTVFDYQDMCPDQPKGVTPIQRSQAAPAGDRMAMASTIPTIGASMSPPARCR